LFYESKFERFETVRSLVRTTLHATENSDMNQETWSGVSGVSSFAAMLAMRRGQSPEIAATAGLLHRYYFMKTGLPYFPGPNSAEAVRPILRDSLAYSDVELRVILRSIFYHEARALVHGPYEEIIKDAIMLQMYFQRIPGMHDKTDLHRLTQALIELGIEAEHGAVGPNADIIEPETNIHNTEDKRLIIIRNRLNVSP